MLVPQQRRGEPARLVLAGDLDVSNVARTRACLDDLLATGVHEVEVDVADVTFMDLRTLRVLLRADAQLRARGGWLRLVRPARIVRRLLAVTGTQHLGATDARPSRRVTFHQAQAA